MGCCYSFESFTVVKTKKKPIVYLTHPKLKTTDEDHKVIDHTKHHKKPISKKFKQELWNEHITSVLGPVVGVYCPLCVIYSTHPSQKIYADQFSCGHVIAESKGGELTLQNCRPICDHCNSKMYNNEIRLPLIYQKIQ